MKLKKYTNILKIVSAILCFAIIYILFVNIPKYRLSSFMKDNIPNIYFSLWLITFWLEGLPIVVCGYICMKIYGNIGNNIIFSRKNLKYVKIIEKIVTALVIIVAFALVFSIYFYINYNYNFIIIHITYFLTLSIVYFLIKILLEIIKNAVELKEEQDLTV